VPGTIPPVAKCGILDIAAIIAATPAKPNAIPTNGMLECADITLAPALTTSAVVFLFVVAVSCSFTPIIPRIAGVACAIAIKSVLPHCKAEAVFSSNRLDKLPIISPIPERESAKSLFKSTSSFLKMGSYLGSLIPLISVALEPLVICFPFLSILPLFSTPAISDDISDFTLTFAVI